MTMLIPQAVEAMAGCLKHEVDVMTAQRNGTQEEVGSASAAHQRGRLKLRDDGTARGSDDWKDGLVAGGLFATNTLHKPLMVPITPGTRKRLASKVLEPFE